MTIQQQINDLIDSKTASVSHYPQVSGIVSEVKDAIAQGVDTLVEGIKAEASAQHLSESLVDAALIRLGLVAEPEPEPEPEVKASKGERITALEAQVAALTKVAQQRGLL